MSARERAGLRELARRMVSGEAPPAPVAALIGFSPRRIGDGEAVFEMEPGSVTPTRWGR